MSVLKIVSNLFFRNSCIYPCERIPTNILGDYKASILKKKSCNLKYLKDSVRERGRERKRQFVGSLPG